jgi:predicted nucleic acid-binding protein
MGYLLDTWCWMQYFQGKPLPGRVRELIDSGRSRTCMITFAEISDLYHREGRIDADRRIDFIASTSIIVDLDPMVCDGAGRTKWSQRKKKRAMSLADAMIYETAQQNELILLSGDPDFKGLDGVEFVEGD